MKILVTGGNGFIGCNFVRYIFEKYPDYKIVNIDKLTYAGNMDNLKDVENNPNYEFIRGDICDKKVVDLAMEGIDIVVNFAAESHVDRSIMNSDSFVKTDVFGVYVLLEAAKRHKINRFVQISTDEVYGAIKEGSFNEKDRLTPRNPYSSSKAGGELIAMSYFITHKLPVVVTRSANNFGPYQYPEKLVPCFVTRLLQDKKVPLHGEGLAVRDWLYVIDNCEAIDLVMHKGEIGEIYNIGADNEKPVIDITKFILKELEKDEFFKIGRASCRERV